VSKPNYTQLAFHNLTNYAFLGATAASTVAFWPRVGLFPLAVGAGLEILWLLVGSELPFAKRRIDQQLAEQAANEAAEKRRALLGTLGDEDRKRYARLVRLQGEIEREVAANPSLTQAALQSELEGLAKLPTTFLQIAADAARFERFVAGSDLNDLERQVRTQEMALEKQSDPDTRSIAQKNLAILQKRIERAKDVHGSVRITRGQLNLIDNTVHLIRDQIVTMRSPRELAGQLEELTGSIEGLAASRKSADDEMRKLELEVSR